MGTNRIIIIGGGIMQIPLIKQAKIMGLEVYVVDKNPQCPGMDYADTGIVADISDEEKVLQEVKKAIPQKLLGGLSGVVTVGTDYSRTVSRVGEYYRVPVLPYDQAQVLTDKSSMREKLTAAGLPQPDFLTAEDEGGVIDALKHFAQKNISVVIKPVDSMGARGVKKIPLQGYRDRLEDLTSDFLSDFHKAIGYSRKKKVIIEEMISGKEYSLDALMYRGEVMVTGVADRIIEYPPYFVETGHVIPSQAGEEAVQKLKEGFMSAIGVITGGEKVSGAFKGDVFIREDHRGHQVVVGEVAGRLSGGYMSGYTYPLSSGVNLMEAVISISLGRDPFPLEERDLGVVIERAVIGKPGRVIDILHEKEAGDCPGVEEVFIHVKKGDVIASPENNLMKSANLIVRAGDYGLAKSYMSRALQLLQVITG